MKVISNILFIIAVVLFFVSLGYFEISTRRMRKTLKTDKKYNPKPFDKKGLVFLAISICFGILSILLAIFL